MDNSNLVVRFMLAGDGRPHVRHAARIKVGDGGLLLYDALGRAVETIELRALQSFCLQWVGSANADSALSA